MLTRMIYSCLSKLYRKNRELKGFVMKKLISFILLLFIATSLEAMHKSKELARLTERPKKAAAKPSAMSPSNALFAIAEKTKNSRAKIIGKLALSLSDKDRPTGFYWRAEFADKQAKKEALREKGALKTLENQSETGKDMAERSYENNLQEARTCWENEATFRLYDNHEEATRLLMRYEKAIAKTQAFYEIFLIAKARNPQSAGSNNAPAQAGSADEEKIKLEVRAHFLHLHMIWDVEAAQTYWLYLKDSYRTFASPRSNAEYINELFNNAAAVQLSPPVIMNDIPDSQPTVVPTVSYPDDTSAENSKPNIEPIDAAAASNASNTPAAAASSSSSQQQIGTVTETFNRLACKEGTPDTILKRNELLCFQFTKHIASAKNYCKEWIKVTKPELQGAALEEQVQLAYTGLKKSFMG